MHRNPNQPGGVYRNNEFSSILQPHNLDGQEQT